MGKRLYGNGGGSITEVKDKKGKKKYRVRVTISSEYDEATGKAKQVQKSLGTFKTRKEAEEVLIEYQRSPYDLTSKVTTLEDLYESWSSEYYSNITISAMRTYKSAWTYCDSIKRCNIRDLNVGVLENFLKDCSKVSDQDGVLVEASPNIKARVKSLLNLSLDYAVKHELIPSNPARKFNLDKKVVKQIKSETKHKKAFLEEEVELFWSNVGVVPFTDMLLINIYTGMRPQELATLPVNRVHFAGEPLEDSELYDVLHDQLTSFRGDFLDEYREDYFRKTVNYLRDKDFIVWGMKTEAGTDRIIPIHPKVLDFLKTYRKSAIEFFDSPLVFNNSKGQRGTEMTYDKWRGMFKTIMSQYKLIDYTPHCSRVTFSTRATYRQKLDKLVVKKIIGHEPDEQDLLESTYTHITVQDIFTEFSKLG